MKTSLRPNVSRPLLAASLAALVSFGCSDQAAESPTAPVADPDLSARSSSPAALQQDLGLAPAAQKRHGPRLMAIPGVVGHGVGLIDGEPGIKVFLLKPGVAGVPARLDDVPTAVEVTGMFVAGGTTDKTDPTPNGYSVGHPNITAGTLGTIVRATSDDQCYILSNNHVLADVNKASIGDNTLQPGPFDGGQNPADAIGTLADFEPIDLSGNPTNEMDAAISAIFSPADVTGSAPGPSDSPRGYGTPSATAVASSLNDDVQKFGRTTLWTHGRIGEVNVTASICYECAGPFCFGCKAAGTFINLVSIPDATATDADGDPANFSDGGDSGSLIVTEAGNNPTALLFAGSSTRTLAHPLQPVLNRFNVVVETDMTQCANGGTPVDNPPSVSITEPSEGETVSGSSVTVAADASDDGLVTQVEFFANGTSIGIDSNSSGGWSVVWNTTDGEADGPYALTATATDDASTPQSTTSDPVDVTVDNTDDPPSVTITNPAGGSTVSGTVTVTADATDDNAVTQVEFFVDGSSIGIDSTDPYSATWETTAYSDGDHNVSATASDGSQSTTDQVSATVDNSTPPPSTMHVGDLDGSGLNNGRTWDAIVTIHIHDSSEGSVVGASVSGTWTEFGGGSVANDFCVTGDSGSCTVRVNGMRKNNGSVVYTVDDVTDSLTYDESANHDADGGSNGTSITVSKP